MKIQKPRRTEDIPNFDSLTYVENWLLPSGTVYTGDLYNGKASGRGCADYPRGTIIRGEFFNNIPHGRAIETRIDGSIYEGEFRHGRRKGCGKLTLSNGSFYVGQFSCGNFSGRGIRIRPDGTFAQCKWFLGVQIRPKMQAQLDSQVRPKSGVPSPPSTPSSRSISDADDAPGSAQATSVPTSDLV